jgi:hypothetical protein
MPIFAWLIVMLCYLPNTKWAQNFDFLDLGIDLCCLYLGYSIMNANFLICNNENLGLLRSLLYKSKICQSLPSKETVLLVYSKHPIIARDASYYIAPLNESRDRLCVAINRFLEKPSQFYKNYKKYLPTCNFYLDFIHKDPLLVDLEIANYVAEDSVLPTLQNLMKNYHYSNELNLFIRNDQFKKLYPERTQFF